MSSCHSEFPYRRLAIILFLLSLFDGVMTIVNVHFGAHEINPLLSPIIGESSSRFFAVKLLMTIPLPTALWFMDAEKRVLDYVLGAVLCLYSLVAVWHLVILGALRFIPGAH